MQDDLQVNKPQQAFRMQEPLVLVLSCTRVVRMPVYPIPLPSGFSCTAGLPCTPELLPLITPPQKGRQANQRKSINKCFLAYPTWALWIDLFDHSPFRGEAQLFAKGGALPFFLFFTLLVTPLSSCFVRDALIFSVCFSIWLTCFWFLFCECDYCICSLFAIT